MKTKEIHLNLNKQTEEKFRERLCLGSGFGFWRKKSEALAGAVVCWREESAVRS